MKKGIQYSHYCGTEILEGLSLIWLIKDDIKNNDIESANKYLDDLKKDIENLYKKIGELDMINEMKY